MLSYLFMYRCVHVKQVTACVKQPMLIKLYQLVPSTCLMYAASLQVTPSAHFQKDLGLDSLDTVEVVMAFEEEFAIEIPDVEADKILSTSDAVQYISAHPQAK